MIMIAIIFQLCLIGAVFIGLWTAGIRTRRDSAAKIVGGLLVLLGLGAMGIWIWPPLWGYAILAAIFIAISLRRWSRTHAPHDGKSMLLGFTHWRTLLSSGLGLTMLMFGIKGRLAPAGDFIEFTPPLSVDAQHCVLSGGSSLSLNLHYLVGVNGALNEELHSIDFIKLNKGFRMSDERLLSPKPRAPQSYAVWGSEIYAPCSGEVTGIETGKIDALAGHKYRDRSGSNHVTMVCDGSGVHVMMAHMQNESARVVMGERVEAGDVLGLVGNTGNTEEPHLHIHAFRENMEGARVPVPMRFEGRYLARGNCL